jgi:hypothetical protein
MHTITKPVNYIETGFRPFPGIALLVSAAGSCAAQGITEITLPGTRVFPESITSTPEGTLIIGSLGHGNILRVAPKKTVAEEWIKPGTGGLNGVLGVFADERGRQLWVCSNNLENKGEATGLERELNYRNDANLKDKDPGTSESMPYRFRGNQLPMSVARREVSNTRRECE